MHKLFIYLLLLTPFFSFSQLQKSLAPEIPVTEDFHGIKVKDEYRNLENLKDSTILKWYKTEGLKTRSLLDSIAGREEIVLQLKKLYDNPSAALSNMVVQKDRIFYLKRNPMEVIAKLYYKMNGKKEELLFNPEILGTKDKKTYNVDYFTPSSDNKKVILGVSESGTEMSVIRVIDVETKVLLPEKISRCIVSDPRWLPNNKGFFYSRQSTDDPNSPDPYLNSKSFLHKLGTDPEKDDKEVFSIAKNPNLGIRPEDFPLIYTSEENPDVIISVLAGARISASYFVASLADTVKGDFQWKKVADLRDGVAGYLVLNNELLLLTNDNAPNFKVVKTSVSMPDFKTAETVVPETDLVIKSMVVNKNGLYYNGFKGTADEIYRIPLVNNKLSEKTINLTTPLKGSYVLYTNNTSDDQLLIEATSWTVPTTYFSYDYKTNLYSNPYLVIEAKYPELKHLVVKEVEVTSYDGVKVPLTLIYPNTIKLDGSNPLYLTGYGAYGISMEPYFDRRDLAWCLAGGVFGIAHVRGGGEKGEKWRLAGQKKNKPNTWKDFIACAQYVITNKYTSAKKLVGEGTSAGGVLIGRAITERPELFAVAIAKVGMLNAIRAETSPNGPNNVYEFGDTSTEEGFRSLLEMDAYHHIKEGEKYPATLVTTSLIDTRVSAWESGKFFAKLQKATSSDKPVLLDITENGHGVGNSLDMSINSVADIYSFALWQIGSPKFILKK